MVPQKDDVVQSKSGVVLEEIGPICDTEPPQGDWIRIAVEAREKEKAIAEAKAPPVPMPQPARASRPGPIPEPKLEPARAIHVEPIPEPKLEPAKFLCAEPIPEPLPRDHSPPCPEPGPDLSWDLRVVNKGDGPDEDLIPCLDQSVPWRWSEEFDVLVNRDFLIHRIDQIIYETEEWELPFRIAKVLKGRIPFPKFADRWMLTDSKLNEFHSLIEEMYPKVRVPEARFSYAALVVDTGWHHPKLNLSPEPSVPRKIAGIAHFIQWFYSEGESFTLPQEELGKAIGVKQSYVSILLLKLCKAKWLVPVGREKGINGYFTLYRCPHPWVPK